MTITIFLLLILLGAMCGTIAELIFGWSWGGFVVSAAVGFIGTAIGDWLGPLTGFPSLLAFRIEGRTIDLFWSLLGATALLMMMSVYRRSSYYRRPIF